MAEFLDEDVDLRLGTAALVTGVCIPPPVKGLWLWGHKVRKPYPSLLPCMPLPTRWLGLLQRLCT